MRSMRFAVLAVASAVLLAPVPIASRAAPVGQYCPATIVLEEPDNCAKSSTGCICTGCVDGYVFSWGGCDGCSLFGSYEWDCNGLGSQGEERCDLHVGCDSDDNCERACPCNSSGWLEIGIECGSCC